VLTINTKKETTQLHKALDKFHYFLQQKAHTTLQELTKVKC